MKTSNLVKIGMILLITLALGFAASSSLYAADYALSISAQNGTVDVELISGQAVWEEELICVNLSH